MKEEYEILYNDLKGKETVDDIYNLITILDRIYNNHFSKQTILESDDFLEYLLKNNKISNRLFYVTKYHKNYLIEKDIDNVLEILYNNMYDVEIKNLDSNGKLDYLYYLLALYISNNEDEKDYFLNEYIHDVIDDMDIYDYDFFEELDKKKFNYELYDEIKIYHIIDSNKKTKEKQIEEQIEEDNDIIEKESTKNRFINC